MIRKRMARLETVQRWVNGFNVVPTRMIVKLMMADSYDWCEVIRPAENNAGTDYLEAITMWGTMCSFNDSCDEQLA